MLDQEGREFKKIVSVAAPVAGNPRMTECYLECGHMVCARKPIVGNEARCRRCERTSERTDVATPAKDGRMHYARMPNRSGKAA